MENRNIEKNLFIKQIQDSDVFGYNVDFIAKATDYEFAMLDKAYEGTGRQYAKLKSAIDQNKCTTETCEFEVKRLKQLENSPQASLDFIADVVEELNVTDETNYDVSNNFAYRLAYSIMSKKPGFSKGQGYDIRLHLLEDRSQQMEFIGPMFDRPLIINSYTLNSLLESDTSIVASTPDINKDMMRLLTETGIFMAEDIGPEGDLLPSAKVSAQFILKGPDQKPDYEIIDIGMGKGRNVLRFDLDKIEKKAAPFINAEVSGLLSSEQEVIAAWNVFISKGTSQQEDDQMVQNANAASSSWSYEEDLPLMQDKKEIFRTKYKEYFMNNYLKQFITNKFPTVEADAAVFDLAEAKQAKAQKFMDDNKLN